jgi:hypothetical protein
MAYQETPESKQAVLELGRAIIKGRTNPPAPSLMKALPSALHQSFNLRKDRAGYLRSHLVLNSLYYLGHENMLDLDHTTEAVTAPYERKDPSGSRSKIQHLIVKYFDSEQAKNALAHFHQTYLPDYPLTKHSISSESMKSTFPIEDGWLGYKFHQKTLTVVFECPNQETARAIISEIK